MEFVPSVSRSSGLEDGGDALKGHKLQKDYRDFIQDKIKNYWREYPLASHLTATATPEQRNTQTNILILFRKLREGLIASNRIDDFALEVYVTSLHLSVIFRAPAQTISIIAQLIPHGARTDGFYHEYAGAVHARTVGPSQPETPADASGDLQGYKLETSKLTARNVYRPPHARRGRPLQSSHQSDLDSTADPRPQARPPVPWPSAMTPMYLSTWLLSLLHTLLQTYPSRSIYYSQLKIFQRYPNSPGTIRWLTTVLAALESRNYIRFESLTRASEVDALFRSLASVNSPWPDTVGTDIGCFALKFLVVDLRANVRETAWAVMRTAYREMDVSQSADWFLRVLLIDPGTGLIGSAVTATQSWLEERPASEVGKKELEGAASEGRWILYRRK